MTTDERHEECLQKLANVLERQSHALTLIGVAVNALALNVERLATVAEKLEIR